MAQEKKEPKAAPSTPSQPDQPDIITYIPPEPGSIVNAASHIEVPENTT